MQGTFLKRDTILRRYDVQLIGLLICMLGCGFVFVASASITLAERNFGQPLYYLERQAIAVALGLSVAFLLTRIPLSFWQRSDRILLMLGILSLILVLVPGIGREVNGSMRWLTVHSFSLQPSELVKFSLLLYLAGYLQRHAPHSREKLRIFLVPICILAGLCLLLLLEPDYGAAAVFSATAFGVLFMGGVPIVRFCAWLSVALISLVTLLSFSTYRMHRLFVFLDPWQDPYNHGFQLTQALIAFGRGGWWGEGIGGGLQKLFFLPEAHTDFVFAVMAEELGLIGSIAVILMFYFLVCKCCQIGRTAAQAGQQFSSSLAYGIGLMIGAQSFINIGVNMGAFPTKGLTLPLMSYGGSSILVTCALLGLLMRVHFELPLGKRGRE